jgi:hypothetical protein
MENPQTRSGGLEARDKGRRGVRRLTVWAAAAGIAAVGIFGAIGAATIPGTAKASATPPTSSSSSSSSSSTSSDDSADEGVQAPASAPTSASSSGPTHAVSGAS